jgi:phage shock protein A
VTSTATEGVDALREQVEAKCGEIAEQAATISDLKEKVTAAAVKGGDTTAARGRVRAAEERLEDLGVQRDHLEERLGAAERRERVRSSYAALAELYSADVAWLKAHAQVVRLHLEYTAAKAARGRLDDFHTGRKRLTEDVMLTLAGADQLSGGDRAARIEDRRRMLADPRMPTIEALGGVLNNGGDTVEAVEAEIARFERLVAQAEAQQEQAERPHTETETS